MADIYVQGINSTITQLQSQLLELSRAQQELLETITKAESSSKLTEAELGGMKANMDKVGLYHTKLLSLKANMSMLSGRSKQLQERANKLKSLKLEYLSQVDSIRKIEQEKDMSIAAKTLSPTPSIPKKKKKTKARQVLLDDDGDTSQWVPKRSLSQKDLCQ
ncbi:uncharacterized protein B0P05DRAFT_591291 [Gilbertella persicaria]|uniref:uncharacterized protein n=1 Tax=Gilbertella persicaria TaxID=101096 RepID=UPI0022207F76|nr:uncharacterized protein B0P05DRAFT_591291 [Gilbertella persicaria]KAI8056492.1 hypothetical protein B0P05DRAFT_591291 [Gilbertella persicaria]